VTRNDLVLRLAKLDTCALSDALDRHGAPGTVTGIRPMWPCERIAGRVVTVKLRSADGEKPSRHLCTAAVETARPGDVIVVEHAGRIDVSGWGGLLSLAAKLKGVSGVIIDGACRDVDQSREVGFPVYARAAVPVSARGRVVEESFNESIRIGNVVVTPGDFVIADWSGVVFVAAEGGVDLVATAEEIAAREDRMAKDLRAGRSVIEVMGGGYESMVTKP
jgi:4-hydroxy-4-methyl-2-oxoglutarate aldolase